MKNPRSPPQQQQEEQQEEQEEQKSGVAHWAFVKANNYCQWDAIYWLGYI